MTSIAEASRRSGRTGRRRTPVGSTFVVRAAGLGRRSGHQDQAAACLRRRVDHDRGRGRGRHHVVLGDRARLPGHGEPRGAADDRRAAAVGHLGRNFGGGRALRQRQDGGRAEGDRGHDPGALSGADDDAWSACAQGRTNGTFAAVEAASQRLGVNLQALATAIAERSALRGSLEAKLDVVHKLHAKIGDKLNPIVDDSYFDVVTTAEDVGKTADKIVKCAGQRRTAGHAGDRGGRRGNEPRHRPAHGRRAHVLGIDSHAAGGPVHGLRAAAHRSSSPSFPRGPSSTVSRSELPRWSSSPISRLRPPARATWRGCRKCSARMKA